MTGPCLCGDPACPHCGNRGALAFEDQIEELWDVLDKQNVTEFELKLFIKVGLAAVHGSRELLKVQAGMGPDEIAEREA